MFWENKELHDLFVQDIFLFTILRPTSPLNLLPHVKAQALNCVPPTFIPFSLASF